MLWLRLPTVAAWECIARGGDQTITIIYGFGDQVVKEGVFLANAWAGKLPIQNIAKDGWALPYQPVSLAVIHWHPTWQCSGTVHRLEGKLYRLQS